jgi:hypothetical protein
MARLLRKRDFSLSKRFSVVKFAAKARGLPVLISKGEYAKLIVGACHWCGGTLSPTGGGLDRLDNTLGYTVANCVPCCPQCNNAKNDYPVEELLAFCQRVFNKRVQPNSLGSCY